MQYHCTVTIELLYQQKQIGVTTMVIACCSSLIPKPCGLRTMYTPIVGDTINSGPGDPGTRGPGELRIFSCYGRQKCNYKPKHMVISLPGVFKSAWHKSEDISALSSSLSSSLFHFKILSDTHVPRSPAPPVKSDSRTLHKATKKHLTFVMYL